MADIQTLVNNIPDAQDGNIITSYTHNSVKTALEAIAGALAGGAAGGSVTLNLPPSFLSIAGSTPWNVKVGFAEDSGNSSDGWIPLNLPEGAVLTNFAAMGLKTNAAPAGSINLMAVPIDGATTNVLATINLNAVAINNPFNISIPIQVKAALQGLLTVQNSQFKYVIEANVSFSTAAASVTLYSMQVIYTAP
jgi:hypothetical protein